MGGCIYWMAYFRLYWAFGNTPNEQSQMIDSVKQPIVGFSNRRFTLNQSFVKNNCLCGYCSNPGEHLCTNGRCPVLCVHARVLEVDRVGEISEML